MAISRMQQPRQMYNRGMMVHDPRQAYGLGGFIKKAVRGVKKIAKSPLGKMALLGGLGYGLNAGAFGGFGKGFIGKGLTGLKSGTGFMGGLGNLFRAKSEVPGQLGKFSMGKLALGGLGAASLALPFMGGGGDDEESGSDPMDPAAVTQRARNYYSGQGDAGVGLDFMPKKKYVSQNFYAANGGRAGYANGQLVTPSGDGSRPGYAGEDGILSTIKNFPKNLKSGFEQIFSGETEAYLGGDQKGMNEAVVADMWGQTLPKETIDMIIDANKKGVDIETIISLTGADPSDVTSVIDMLNQGVESKAYGGRAGYAMGGSLDEDEEDYVRSGAGMSRRQPTAFLNMGGGAGEAQAEQMLMAEFIKYKNKGGDLSFQQFVQAVMQQQEQSQGMEQPTMMAANGGLAGMTSVPGYGTPAGTNQFGYPSGGERVNAAEGGIMDTEQAEMIDMGGNEKDYRDEGGFVAMGGEERADDVPARLSKNEFVFTADAVRNAGGGDIDRGSEVMQNLMDNLEQGGQVSEDSQGLGGGEEMMSEEIIQEPDGAQAMYEQQQALQSRMA